MIIAGIGL